MARRYKKRKYRKRRKTRRRKKLGFNKQILGNTHACKLKYSQDITVTPQFNAQPNGHALEVFSANGMFNTRIGSVTDHQPRGFDQLMALYHHYTVVGSRCTVKYAPDELGAPAHCGISLCAASTRLPDLYSYLEKRNNKDKLLVPPGRFTVVSMPCSPKKFLKVPSVLSNPECQGAIGSNPVEEIYYHIYMGALAPVATGTANISISIDYAVVFSEPQTPPMS